jgi:SAM-dependent methyltransferase
MKILSHLATILSKELTYYGRRKRIFFYDQFLKELQDCETVLDLGCGKSSPIQKLYPKPKFSMGVDIFEKYIKISKSKKIHNKYLLCDVLEIDKKVPPNSYECVISVDVLEHLSKLDGIKLIKKMEKIAIRKVIIFTPNGFVKQDHYDKNIYQIHKSGWKPKIFQKMGFKVYGINGLKSLRGDLAQIKYEPKNFWEIISIMTSFFTKRHPELAYQLLCIKNLNND